MNPDQYNEKKPKDKTIAEKFNTYRFADYKDHVINLLQRVCTVSVKTMEIIGKMVKGIRVCSQTVLNVVKTLPRNVGKKVISIDACSKF